MINQILKCIIKGNFHPVEHRSMLKIIKANYKLGSNLSSALKIIYLLPYNIKKTSYKYS